MQKQNVRVDEEWERLILEAKDIGITPTEIREFLKQKKLNLTS